VFVVGYERDMKPKS